MVEATAIHADGREIRLTHPDRVLWPRTGTTKRELIRYYLDIAPALLPHVIGRGLTLGRWPADVEHEGWLQAECRGRPEWLPVHRVVTRAGGVFGYCMVEDRAGLAWLANLGTIELHPFLALAARPDEPSFVVVDLDPGSPAGIAECATVALRVRDRLLHDGLECFAKTSGMAGLHVYAPLRSGHTFAGTKAYARALAAELASDDAAGVTDQMARAARSGRVYVDWVQNDASRSTVAAYSPRAAAVPRVSTPLSWGEVDQLARSRDPRPVLFGLESAIARVDAVGDMFAPTLAPGGVLPVSAEEASLSTATSSGDRASPRPARARAR